MLIRPLVALALLVARQLPGFGKAPWGPMKHMRLAHNAADGWAFYRHGDGRKG